MNLRGLLKVNLKGNKKRIVSVIVSFALVLLLIGLDQLTKYIANNSPRLLNDEEITFIPYLINFRLIYNTGAAFGMLSGNKVLLSVISFLAGIFFCFLVVRFCSFEKRNIFCTLAIIAITAGTYGNMIDRIFFEQGVIDFIQFTFWPSFAIFNFADSCLTVGAFLLIIHILFFTDDNKSSKDNNQEEGEQIDA